MKPNQERQLGQDHQLAALAATPVGGSPVPSEVLLVPWGQVESSNGSFVVDDESARLAIEAFEEHGTDLPIDYEHQTLGGPFTSPSGQAPAAGWIKKLEARPGQGIFAHVEWTEPAAQQLAARQYRYLSPVAIVRKADRKLIALHSLALTNKPAIVGMEPIVASDTANAPPQAVAVLRSRLQMEAKCSETELLVAAAHRLAELEDHIRLSLVEQKVADALVVGKLTPAQRSWATRLALRDEALFDEFVASASAVVLTGRLSPPDTASIGEASRTAQARAEYRAYPQLAALTTEEAYIAEALRSAG